MNYIDALNYIYSFTNFEITPAGAYSPKTFDLSRVERLLAALGDPHRQFKSIHVAGTKGKGSTSAMIERILRAAGHRTGFFISPHLHTFRERIGVNGAMISQLRVIGGVQKLQPLVPRVPGITAFELMTTLAFASFAERGVEFAVVEVGLGGRLDATNVIAPCVSAITSISYDHMAILGNTLAQIAREKAGIIKSGVPVVSSPQHDEAMRVIEKVAQEKNAPLTVVSPELEFQLSGAKFQVVPVAQNLDAQTFALAQSNLEPKILNLKLLGKHQLVNAATALAVVQLLRGQDIVIPDDAIRTGLASVEWHGRFEILAREPFIIVDGAHNADSAHQLLATLRDYFPTARLHLIFGASNDKDIAGMFAELLPHAASLVLTRSHNPRAAEPARLAQLTEPYHIETEIASDVSHALQVVRLRAEPDDVVCVTGSLFVVAEARESLLAERGVHVVRDD